jgi:aspartyl-tRNA(Asn)/glutamyl-tRNA(Gln) amidotransferase subunit C
MLDEAQVQTLARLARIRVEATEVPALAKQLSRILELIEQMQAVATHDVEPLAHPLELAARRRADAVTEVDQRDAMQAIAPATADGYYLVPRVID